MGGHHAWALQALHAAELTDARLAVVYDANPERLAAAAGRLGAPAAPHLAGMVEDVDIVWICTWTAAHLETARVAAAAGRAVFVEKPLAPTLADCEALAALLRGTPHQVGLILRHAPAYALVVSEVGSGRYGRPMGAFFRDDQRFPVDATYGSTWRADAAAAGGGTLIEHSIHDVDVLSWLLGPPAAVSAQTTSFAGVPGIEDLAMVRMRFAEGHSAGLLSVWHRVESRTTNRRLEVFCEDAVLWMDGEVGPLHVETSSGVTVHDVPMPAFLDQLPLAEVPEGWRLAAGGLAIQARSFLEALREGKPAGWPTVDDALVAHRAVDAAYRSAAGGGAEVSCAP